MDPFQRSIDIILANQNISGAYVACPNFPTYQYCWFRDGSFCAYAMDLVGQFDSAARFHAWAAGVINQRANVVIHALELAADEKPLGEAEILHTRYTLDGQDGIREEWPNFQLDGFGTWLWALNEHRKQSNLPLPSEWIQAASVSASYLEALWQRPCFDCWEEFSDNIHLHTLAVIFSGLQACQELDGCNRSNTLADIKRFIFENGVANGIFTKFIGSNDVDANLLAVCLPSGPVSCDHPVMKATVSEIERQLYHGGGVHRYQKDTYYGGGEWVLLAGWLGWYFAATGQSAKADKLLAWMKSSANKNGELPEQVPASLNDPEYYQPWVDRWGKIATPLLWSHASFLILKKILEESKSA